MELYELLMPCNTVRSEMLPFSGNNQKYNSGDSHPEHFAIGYVHNDNLPLGNIALQLIIRNNVLEDLMVFSDEILHFLKINILPQLEIHPNYLRGFNSLLCVPH